MTLKCQKDKLLKKCYEPFEQKTLVPLMFVICSVIF